MFPNPPFVAGRRGFRADYNLTRHIAWALGYVHFSVGATVVAVGGHDTDYFGAEVRYG
jgi:hypothetical protein